MICLFDDEAYSCFHSRTYWDELRRLTFADCQQGGYYED